MTQHGAHRHHWRSCDEQVGCYGVPKIVEAKVPDACVLADALPGSLQAAGIHRLAHEVREYRRVGVATCGSRTELQSLLQLVRVVFLQKRYPETTEVDPPEAAFSLRTANAQGRNAAIL